MKKRRMAMVILLGGCLVGCGASPLMTVKIYEDPQRIVRLQTFPGINEAKGFTHPAYLKEKEVKRILRGIHVEIDRTSLSLPFMGSSQSSTRRRAFSDPEIEFFSRHIVEGLKQATPEEVVTFFETAEISDLHRITTSGGVFIEGNVLYVLMSNYSSKTEIWQDNEQYDAPFRLRPLEPIDQQPGRLVFEPQNLMVEVKEGFLQEAVSGDPWEVGIRYKELK